MEFDDAQALCPHADGPILSNGKGIFVGNYISSDGDHRLRLEFNTNAGVHNRKQAYLLTAEGRFRAWEMTADKSMKPMVF